MRENGISASCLRMLYAMASNRAETPDEADDLVQDLLLFAIEQRRDFDEPRFPAWASGVLRRHALFVSRTAGRRRRREAEYAAESGPGSAPARERKLPRPFIESLAPSLQTVALLANAGLGRAEIRSLLNISDAALRQRISGLRRAWKCASADAEHPDLPEILSRHAPPTGPRRRALKASLRRLPGGRMAIVDPDGHPLLFSNVAHNRSARGN